MNAISPQNETLSPSKAQTGEVCLIVAMQPGKEHKIDQDWDSTKKYSDIRVHPQEFAGGCRVTITKASNVPQVVSSTMKYSDSLNGTTNLQGNAWLANLSLRCSCKRNYTRERTEEAPSQEESHRGG